jgi:predicted ester cyclase
MEGTNDRNRDLVRELYGSLMARGDEAAARRIHAEDYVDHDVPGPVPGNRDGLIAAVAGVRAAFPDVRPELFETIAERDWVSVRVEAGGTHTGAPFMGIEATGRSMRWKELHHYRCDDGRIVEHRGVFDLLGILVQLGAVTLPAA